MRMVMAALAAAAALAHAGAAAAEGACRIVVDGTLKVRMVDDQPLVPVKINGTDTYLLADTGAFYSTVTKSKADKLKLLSSGQFMEMVGVGGAEEAELRRAQTFEWAGRKDADVPFLSDTSFYGTEAVGLLGENAFRGGDQEYDLAHGLIRIVHPLDCQAGGQVVFWRKPGEGLSSIEVRPASLEFPHVQGYVFVNGVRLTAYFDTGASATYLTHAGAHRAGVATDGPGVKPAGRAYGIGGSVPVVVAPVKSIKIGDEEITNTRVKVSLFEIDEPDMLIGADFFMSHHLYVSRADRRIYFTYNGGPVFSTHIEVRGTEAALHPEATTSGPAASAAPPPPAATTAAEADAAARKGDADLSRRDVASALKNLDVAVAFDPKNPVWRYDRARARVAAKDLEGADADCAAVLEAKPGDLNALELRVAILAGLKRRSEASALLAKADKITAPDDFMRLEFAMLHRTLYEYPAAVADYDSWLSSAPDAGSASVVKGNRCRAEVLGNLELDRALGDCGAALRAATDPSVLSTRGLLYLRRGDADHALKDFDAALRNDPDEVWAAYGRGLALAKLGRSGEAKPELVAAAAKHPDVARLAKRVGLAPEGELAAAASAPKSDEAAEEAEEEAHLLTPGRGS